MKLKLPLIREEGDDAIKAAKALTPEFVDICTKTRKGVLIFSFGSLAHTKRLSKRKNLAFIEAFAKFHDYEFIWKVNPESHELIKDPDFPKADNVHVVNWFDQISLLRHPKTKAFITQCGLNSLNKATYTGIPMIGIPLFSYQFYNAAVVKHKEIGAVVEIGTITSETVAEALDEVLNNPKYKKNIEIKKRKTELYPFNPLEEFVKRVEYAAEFENMDELNLASAKLKFAQIYYLDVIGAIVGVFAMAHRFFSCCLF